LQHFATLFHATLFEFLWYKMDIIAGSASETFILLFAIIFVWVFYHEKSPWGGLKRPLFSNFRKEKMKLKALNNIILPNKKEVKVGEIFNYNGDLKPLTGIVEIIPEEKKTEVKEEPELKKDKQKEEDVK
jgi:hypothetical protein